MILFVQQIQEEAQRLQVTTSQPLAVIPSTNQVHKQILLFRDGSRVLPCNHCIATELHVNNLEY